MASCLRDLVSCLAKREEPCGELDLRDSPLDEDIGKKEKVKVPTVLLIAHSATYDYQILMKHLFQIRFINKGTSLVCGSALYTHFGKDGDYTIRIEFKDSWKLLPMPLREFKDAFGLDVKKEVMPHNWYTESNVACGLATLEELRKHAGDELVKNLDSFDCRVGDKYDMLKYSQWYCEQDVYRLDTKFSVPACSKLQSWTLTRIQPLPESPTCTCIKVVFTRVSTSFQLSCSSL